MLPAIYVAIFLLVAGCFSISILYGSSFLDHTALMWLISSAFAFITTVIFLEPMKVMYNKLLLLLFEMHQVNNILQATLWLATEWQSLCDTAGQATC